MEDRSRVIEDCGLMRRSLTDFATLDAKIAKEQEETELITELVKTVVKENASTPQSQAEYLKKYDSLNKRYEATVASLEKLKAERALRQKQNNAMALFIQTLKKNPLVVNKRDNIIWTVLVEKGVVHRDGSITFVLYNGAEKQYKAKLAKSLTTVLVVRLFCYLVHGRVIIKNCTWYDLSLKGHWPKIKIRPHRSPNLPSHSQ